MYSGSLPKSGPGGTGLQVRRQARIVALQALYEIDSVAHPIGIVIEQRIREVDMPEEGQPFVRSLVQGVMKNREQLDVLIGRYAPEWPVDQMSIIDRNVLRIALFEFLIDGGTPPKVAINEAVELAKAFGSDSSPRFVNGVLGTLLSQHGKQAPVPGQRTKRRGLAD
ncbi:MAG: transcription antitermination factor NusB [Anaerolineae bacterium]|nr:transcription antitermination factor NusB [Anaerolineae bacterium]